MKCRECVFMEDFEEGFYRCTNHDSVNYFTPIGICCEDECDDGEYLDPDKSNEVKDEPMDEDFQ